MKVEAQKNHTECRSGISFMTLFYSESGRQIDEKIISLVEVGLKLRILAKQKLD